MSRRRHKVDALFKRAVPERSSMPRMHWRWRRRLNDIDVILAARCGALLPPDDAGLEYVTIIVNHMIRLQPNGASVARANARLWAPWVTVLQLDLLIAEALNTLDKPPISAAQLGKALRLTLDEQVRHGITTIKAFTVTQEADRSRQAKRRRKAGASSKRGRPRKVEASRPVGRPRGRPKSEGMPAWQAAGYRSRSTYQRAKARGLKPAQVDTKNEMKNRHAASDISRTKRDEFRSEFVCHSDWIPAPLGRRVIAGTG